MIPGDIEVMPGGIARFDVITRRWIKVDVKLSVSWLLEYAESRRRLFDLYWRGQLPVEAERLLESEIPPEILIGYKPLDK